jgi:hypothetical protein
MVNGHQERKPASPSRRGLFPVLEIGYHSDPRSEGFRGGVGRSENDLSLPYLSFDIHMEEKVAPSCRRNDLIEVRLIYRPPVGIPPAIFSRFMSTAVTLY